MVLALRANVNVWGGGSELEEALHWQRFTYLPEHEGCRLMLNS
jgi:hypothetical protein